jgi:hypothetical protein
MGSLSFYCHRHLGIAVMIEVRSLTMTWRMDGFERQYAAHNALPRRTWLLVSPLASLMTAWHRRRSF